MAFLWFKTKEEKQNYEQKVKLLAQIKELSILSEALIKRLKEKYSHLSKTPDKSILSLINKVRYLLEEEDHNLDDAYRYLDAFNIPYTIDKLFNAKKSINRITETNIDDLIKLSVFSKSNKGVILIIKSQIGRLAEDLPKYNLD